MSYIFISISLFDYRGCCYRGRLQKELDALYGEKEKLDQELQHTRSELSHHSAKAESLQKTVDLLESGRKVCDLNKTVYISCVGVPWHVGVAPICLSVCVWGRMGGKAHDVEVLFIRKCTRNARGHRCQCKNLILRSKTSCSR